MVLVLDEEPPAPTEPNPTVIPTEAPTTEASVDPPAEQPEEPVDYYNYILIGVAVLILIVGEIAVRIIKKKQ